MLYNIDIKWMRRAVKLAQKHVGVTAPNPAVGCVIVKNGEMLGQGAHEKAGTPHAEIHALNQAGRAAKGATAYVTLEPCNHTGKTPPCSNALIEAGIGHVVIGSTDPNPKVAGKGIRRLQQAGIEVTTGILQAECDDLIADFRVWITQKRPYVIYKVACTLDGVTAIKGRGNWQISSPESQKKVHELRATCDAVVVGMGTWRLDNPDLRPRLARNSKKRPLRVVVGSELPVLAGKLAEVEPETTVWICGKTPRAHRAAWEHLGAHVVRTGGGRPSPEQVLAVLYSMGVYRVLLEGGAHLAGSFLGAGWIDRIVQIVVPVVVAHSGSNTLSLFEMESSPCAKNQRPDTVELKHEIWVDTAPKSSANSSRRKAGS